MESEPPTSTSQAPVRDGVIMAFRRIGNLNSEILYNSCGYNCDAGAYTGLNQHQKRFFYILCETKLKKCWKRITTSLTSFVLLRSIRGGGRDEGD